MAKSLHQSTLLFTFHRAFNTTTRTGSTSIASTSSTSNGTIDNSKQKCKKHSKPKDDNDTSSKKNYGYIGAMPVCQPQRTPVRITVIHNFKYQIKEQEEHKYNR